MACRLVTHTVGSPFRSSHHLRTGAGRCRLTSPREGLPRHRRRRRVQSPRAGCRAAHPHHRRARRGAPSRGRGLRQGGGRQEHLDAASRGRSARPGASDCDPGRGLQRPLTGAHGRCPGGAVRSRQPQGRAPADQERDRGLLDGLADPGVGGARVRERGARRVPYVARHEGVRSPRRDPRVLRVGSARSADVRSAAGSRADRPVRRFSRAADLVPARDDPFRGGAGRGRALGGSSVEGTQSRPRLRREHERLLLPRLQRHQAALCLTRDSAIGPARSPASGPSHSIPSLHGTAIGDPSRGTARNTRWPGPGACGAATAGQPRIEGSLADEVPLRPLRQPDEAADRRPARARLALGRLLVSGVRLRDGDADQCVRNTGRPVTRRADRPRGRGGRVERREPAASARSPR